MIHRVTGHLEMRGGARGTEVRVWGWERDGVVYGVQGQAVLLTHKCWYLPLVISIYIMVKVLDLRCSSLLNLMHAQLCLIRADVNAVKFKFQHHGWTSFQNDTIAFHISMCLQLYGQGTGTWTEGKKRLKPHRPDRELQASCHCLSLSLGYLMAMFFGLPPFCVLYDSISLLALHGFYLLSGAWEVWMSVSVVTWR